MKNEKLIEATNIIKCKFTGKGGELKPREYTYFCNVDVSVGDKVTVVGFKGDPVDVTVSAINVPVAEIEAFKDKVKTVIGKVEPKPVDESEGVQNE